MSHHDHREVYRAIHKHWNLNDTEFLYHFLTFDPEVHRALTDRARGLLGHGAVDWVKKFDEYAVDGKPLPDPWSFLTGQVMDHCAEHVLKSLAGAALLPARLLATSMNVYCLLQKRVYHRPVPVRRSLSTHCRALVRNSVLAQALLDTEVLQFRGKGR